MNWEDCMRPCLQWLLITDFHSVSAEESTLHRPPWYGYGKDQAIANRKGQATVLVLNVL